MELPFFGKKKTENRTFFGLFLKEKTGIGMVLQLKDSRISLIAEQKFTYSNSWENIAEDIDQLILKLEQQSKTHLNETIFFVYSHFIDEKTKEIKQPYFQKIKELVKKLGLKAIGYIECYEAVVSYLEHKEEQPLTAIMIELDASSLTLLIYKRGKPTHSKVLAHTDNIIDDLLTAFNEVKGKFVLPSRIILYNSKDLDEESTQIVTYRWSDDLFVQLPRVEIIKEHEVIQGLLTVFGEQFGKQASRIQVAENKAPEEVLGFVIGEDVAVGPEKTLPAAERPLSKSPQSEEVTVVAADTSNYVQEAPTESEVVSPSASLLTRIDSIRESLSSLPQFLTKKAIVFVGLAIILLALLLNEFFLHKATLIVYLPSQSIEKAVTLHYPGDIDIQKTTKSIDLSDTKATTGKKEIGEKARGTVTVHNFDDREKSFSKGTILESGNQRFLLDQDIKIASSSVVTVSGGLVKQPGKTKAGITAESIGPQANLSSGKQFKIDDFSTSLYFGLNESALTGGTKKDVRTVAKKDVDDLKASLLNNAKKAKLDQLTTAVDSDAKVLSQLTEVTLQNEKYNREVGEEADSLTLQARANATIYLYNDKNLEAHLENTLSEDAPNDFILEKNQLKFNVDRATNEDGKIVLKITADGKFIKNVKFEDVVKQVRGKSVEAVEEAMQEDYKANSIQLDIQPNMFFFNSRMPFFEKNITLKIASS